MDQYFDTFHYAGIPLILNLMLHFKVITVLLLWAFYTSKKVINKLVLRPTLTVF